MRPPVYFFSASFRSLSAIVAFIQRFWEKSISTTTPGTMIYAAPSRLLGAVKKGETILIQERKKIVAKIVSYLDSKEQGAKTGV